MKKEQQQLFAALAMGAVILAVVAYFVWPTPTEAPSEPPQPVVKKEQTPPPSAAKAMTAPPKNVPVKTPPAVQIAPMGGSYETYSPEKVAFAKTGKVVLFFNSPSCEGCKRLDADLRTNSASIPKDVRILEVNFDSDTATKEKYGVMTPHILIQVDATGSRVLQWIGSPSIADILPRLARF